MKQSLVITINDIEKQVVAEIVDKKIWYKVDKKVFSYDLVDLNSSVSRKNKSTQKDVDKILAPMPGKVTKIFIKPNDKVTKGTALVVMEAMKMEYTLKADIDAEVEILSVAVGDQVNLGQLLIKLKVQV